MSDMTALELINILRPEHDRTSCDDDHINNGFYTRNGNTWHGRCTRCMWLEIANGKPLPTNFEPEECFG